MTAVSAAAPIEARHGEGEGHRALFCCRYPLPFVWCAVCVLLGAGLWGGGGDFFIVAPHSAAMLGGGLADTVFSPQRLQRLQRARSRVCTRLHACMASLRCVNPSIST
jgi:hypothetical protein